MENFIGDYNGGRSSKRESDVLGLPAARGSFANNLVSSILSGNYRELESPTRDFRSSFRSAGSGAASDQEEEFDGVQVEYTEDFPDDINLRGVDESPGLRPL